MVRQIIKHADLKILCHYLNYTTDRFVNEINFKL